MLDSGLTCVPSVRQTPPFLIAFRQEAWQLLEILRRSPFARSFLESAPGCLVRCIGAGSSRCVATVWNGELRTRYGRSLHLPHTTSPAARAFLFHPPMPKKS